MRTLDTVFVAKSGKKLIMDVDVGKQHLYSPGGNTYYAIYGGVGRSHYLKGEICEESGNFEIPSLGIDGQFNRDMDTLTWGGEAFTKSDESFDRHSARIISLPNTRKPEYLAFSEDGSVVLYVSASKYEYSYGSFRLFVGNGQEMREVKIEDVQRYRDGGTTVITTNEGTFFSPTHFDKSKQTSWLDTKLIETSRTSIMHSYTIVEDGDGTVFSVIKKS